jgi:simple sugar transport system permease protein
VIRTILQKLRLFAASLVAVVICLAVMIAALSVLKFGRAPGESFWQGIRTIASVVWEKSLLPGFNDHNWFDSLVAATPLMLTGVCVVIAFRANVLNIGGEGQYVAGAIAATAVGLHVTSGHAVTITLVLVAAAVAGGIWAGVAAALYAWRRVPVVLGTLMLNFVAVVVLDAVLQGPLHEKGESLQSEQLPVAARLMHFMLHDVRTGLHSGFVIAIAAIVLVSFILHRTTFGFRLRATGENPTAARFAGIATERTAFLALTLSGAAAGLAGGIQIAALPPYQLQSGAGTSGLGFTGIAVALLARLSPMGVIASAIFFGWLQTAFARLQSELEVPFTAAETAQGLILILMLVLMQMRIARR